MASELISSATSNTELLTYMRGLFHNLNSDTDLQKTQEYVGLMLQLHPLLTDEVVAIIVEKSSERPGLCELYALVCMAQINAEMERKSTETFKNALGLRVQMSTERTLAEKEFQKNVEAEKKAAIDTETDQKKKEELQIELLRVKYEINKRRFEAAQFLGHLFLHDLIPTGIILKWTTELLDSVMNRPKAMEGYEVDETSIERAVALFEIIGRRIHESNLRIPEENAAAAAAKSHQRRIEFPLDVVCNKLETAQEFVGKSLMFRIANLLKLRANGWVADKSATGDKVQLLRAVEEVQSAMEAMRTAMATLEDRHGALLKLVEQTQSDRE